MKRLFSPWRSRYIATFKNPPKKSLSSLFTRLLKQKKDKKNLIVQRKKHCFVMMNLYPYNSGHLMIVPNRQTARLGDLSLEEHAEIMQTASEMMDLLTRVMKPHGFNFGANLGRAAGAGIDDHIHFHIVPRWNGDTNFMPILSETKVVSEEIKKTYIKIKAALSRSSKKRKK